MNLRKMAFAGSFYPNDKNELNRYIKHFDTVLQKANFQIKDLNTRALISPHAGYVYSGFSANAGYKYLQKQDVKTVIVLGPSHKVHFEGISISKYDEYETPYGNLKINQELINDLENKFEFIDFYPEVHKEHSTETQFPFIKKYKNDVQVLELIYGETKHEDILELLKYLLEDKNNFLIISTDLSHFYTQKEANILDNICIEAVKNLEINTFSKGCEACGILGLKAIVDLAKRKSMQSKIIDYRTSFDASNDASRVVGYLCAIIHD